VSLAATAKDGSDNSSLEQSKTFWLQNLGLIAVFASSVCSALAGVTFEKLLKQKNIANTDLRSENGKPEYLASPSVWMRNIQLASFSVVFAVGQNIFNNNSESKDSESVKTFLHGFTPLVWVLVLLRASSGLVVAIVVKRMDTVIKSMASSVSVVAGCVVSMFLFGTQFNIQFWFGAFAVSISCYFFSNTTPVFSAFYCIIGRKRHVLGWFAVCMLLSQGQSRKYLLEVSQNFEWESLAMEGNPIYVKIPNDYKKELHFHVKTATRNRGDSEDCGDCKVLWALHDTLVEQGFSSSASQGCPTPVITNRTIVTIYPEVDIETCDVGPQGIHVRWILAPLGVHTPRKTSDKWGRDDLVFNYATSTGTNVSISNVLQVVVNPKAGDETDIAMTTIPRFTRDCYRYKQGDRDHFEGATLIRDTYPIIEDW
jgi:hypothetical protein